MTQGFPRFLLFWLGALRRAPAENNSFAAILAIRRRDAMGRECQKGRANGKLVVGLRPINRGSLWMTS